MAKTYAHVALDKKMENLTGKHIGRALKEVGIPAYANDPLCIEQVMQLTYKHLGDPPAITYEPAE